MASQLSTYRAATRALGWLSLLGIALLVALITFGVGGTVIRQRAEQRDLQSAKDALDGILRLQLDEETGIRGFAATGQTLFLEPYDAARSEFDSQLNELRRSLVTVGLQRMRPTAQALGAINTQWLTQVAMPLQQRRVAGNDLRTQRLGKKLVDTFRARQNAISLVVNRRSDAIDERARRQITLLAAAGIALSLVLGGAVVALVRRAVEAEHASLQAIQAQTREEGLRQMAEAIPQLVWALDADGERVTYVNDAWIAYTGVTVEQASAGGWSTAIHPDDRQLSEERWRRAHARVLPYESEHRLRSRSGTYRWFLVRATPIFDETRRLINWFGTSTDIDRQKSAEEQLREAFERERRASLAFQEAALPSELPTIPGFKFDAVYRASGSETQVGGDWYDVFRLVDGRIVVTIGDVLGTGINAAVAMNAIRNALRGAAQIFPEPAAMLDAAERTLESEQHDGMVTAFIGILDPVTMSLSHANAGHPTPLLRDASGIVREVAGEPAVPLGVRGFAASSEGTQTLDLDEPSMLLLYTDGLIEAGRDVVAGYAALVEAFSGDAMVSSSNPASALLEQLIDGPSADDVAILAVRIESASGQVRRIGGHLHEHWEVNALDAEAVGSARGEYASILREHGLAEQDVITGELVLMELIGNVLRHGGERAQIRVDVSRKNPVLHVLDHGRGFAYSPMLPLDMLSESGRGLFIISQLTENFTVVPRPSGGSHARAVLSVRATKTPVSHSTAS